MHISQEWQKQTYIEAIQSVFGIPNESKKCRYKQGLHIIEIKYDIFKTLIPLVANPVKFWLNLIAVCFRAGRFILSICPSNYCH